MAILVGANTARIDDPRLTVRFTERFEPHELPALHPDRIILAGASPLPGNLQMWNTSAKTLLCTSQSALCENVPAHVARLYLDHTLPTLPQLCSALYQRSILSLLVEGGGQTLLSFLEAGLWDEIRIITAPTRFERGVPAPTLALQPERVMDSGPDTITIYAHPELRARLAVKATTSIW
jgi:diaminohydroxyphosphoribosylaminopyrimidine deaminase/5-amino-6-(5-phosphoribosylamino)uracil reductase